MTVCEDKLHNKPNTPDSMGEEPSTGDSRDSEHAGPDITFDWCEEFCPQPSHGTFEALVLKIVVFPNKSGVRIIFSIQDQGVK